MCAFIAPDASSGRVSSARKGHPASTPVRRPGHAARVWQPCTRAGRNADCQDIDGHCQARQAAGLVNACKKNDGIKPLVVAVGLKSENGRPF
jgi:hypothetical protein